MKKLPGQTSEYFKDKISDQMVLADIRQSAKANNLVVLFNIDSKASQIPNQNAGHHGYLIRAFNEALAIVVLARGLQILNAR